MEKDKPRKNYPRKVEIAVRVKVGVRSKNMDAGANMWYIIIIMIIFQEDIAILNVYVPNNSIAK